ncbi:MAG: ABC transporter ATP-binding protein [Actinocatenispora sp.]
MPSTLRGRVARTVTMTVRADPVSALAALALAATTGLVPVGTAMVARALVDAVATDAVSTTLVALGVGYAVVLAAGTMAPDVQGYLAGKLARATGFQVNRHLYQAVNADPGLRQLERPEYQDQLHLAGQAGEMAPDQLISSALAIITALVSTVGLTGVMLSIQPAVAGLVLLGTVPVLIAERRLTRLRIANRQAVTPVERRRTFYRSLIVDPTAAKEIRLFGLGRFFHDRMLADLSAANRMEQRLERRTLRVRGLLGIVSGLVVFGCLLLLSRQVRSDLTAGDVAAFLTSLTSLTGALAGVVGAAVMVGEGYLLFSLFQDVVDQPAARTVRSRTTVPALRDAIRIEDVWFRYADDLPWALRGVDLVIPAGGSVALVGLNGSGKSTLVKLLCRLYEPTRGRISWDGVDLAELDPVALRDRIGAVFQDFMPYDLTAADNIGVGDLARFDDDTAITRAAELAQVSGDLAALPQGYRTMLSRVLFHDPLDPETDTTAVQLSGGQWQRVALSRMFLRGDRDLLVLDEPSSGLDPEAEARVHEAVARTMTGRARLLVSHRLSAVREAQLIFVLESGRIVERGTHDELMVRGGRYAALFSRQASGYQDARVDLDPDDPAHAGPGWQVTRATPEPAK